MSLSSIELLKKGPGSDSTKGTVTLDIKLLEDDASGNNAVTNVTIIANNQLENDPSLVKPFGRPPAIDGVDWKIGIQGDDAAVSNEIDFKDLPLQNGDENHAEYRFTAYVTYEKISGGSNMVTLELADTVKLYHPQTEKVATFSVGDGINGAIPITFNFDIADAATTPWHGVDPSSNITDIYIFVTNQSSHTTTRTKTTKDEIQSKADKKITIANLINDQLYEVSVQFSIEQTAANNGGYAAASLSAALSTHLATPRYEPDPPRGLSVMRPMSNLSENTAIQLFWQAPANDVDVGGATSIEFYRIQLAIGQKDEPLESASDWTDLSQCTGISAKIIRNNNQQVNVVNSDKNIKTKDDLDNDNSYMNSNVKKKAVYSVVLSGFADKTTVWARVRAYDKDGETHREGPPCDPVGEVIYKYTDLCGNKIKPDGFTVENQTNIRLQWNYTEANLSTFSDSDVSANFFNKNVKISREFDGSNNELPFASLKTDSSLKFNYNREGEYNTAYEIKDADLILKQREVDVSSNSLSEDGTLYIKKADENSFSELKKVTSSETLTLTPYESIAANEVSFVFDATDIVNGTRNVKITASVTNDPPFSGSNANGYTINKTKIKQSDNGVLEEVATITNNPDSDNIKYNAAASFKQAWTDLSANKFTAAELVLSYTNPEKTITLYDASGAAIVRQNAIGSTYGDDINKTGVNQAVYSTLQLSQAADNKSVTIDASKLLVKSDISNSDFTVTDSEFKIANFYLDCSENSGILKSSQFEQIYYISMYNYKDDGTDNITENIERIEADAVLSDNEGLNFRVNATPGVAFKKGAYTASIDAAFRNKGDEDTIWDGFSGDDGDNKTIHAANFPGSVDNGGWGAGSFTEVYDSTVVVGTPLPLKQLRTVEFTGPSYNKAGISGSKGGDTDTKTKFNGTPFPAPSVKTLTLYHCEDSNVSEDYDYSGSSALERSGPPVVVNITKTTSGAQKNKVTFTAINNGSEITKIYVVAVTDEKVILKPIDSAATGSVGTAIQPYEVVFEDSLGSEPNLIVMVVNSSSSALGNSDVKAETLVDADIEYPVDLESSNEQSSNEQTK